MRAIDRELTDGKERWQSIALPHAIELQVALSCSGDTWLWCWLAKLQQIALNEGAKWRIGCRWQNWLSGGRIGCAAAARWRIGGRIGCGYGGRAAELAMYSF